MMLRIPIATAPKGKHNEPVMCLVGTQATDFIINTKQSAIAIAGALAYCGSQQLIVELAKELQKYAEGQGASRAVLLDSWTKETDKYEVK